MSTTALALRETRFQNKSFWRNPAAAFFTFVFPIMFLVIFNLLFGGGKTRIGPNEVIDTNNFYVPAIAAFSVITACYTNIAMALSFARDNGEVKRKVGTPLPTWAYMFGRITHSVFIALLLVAIVSLFGVVFYGVDLPTSTMLAFIVTLAVGAAAFSALGIAVANVVPNAEAAPAVVNASILPLLFISGIFIPLENVPGWLKTFAGIFPIKHYADAMLTAFDPLRTGGTGFRWDDLGVVALWGAIGAVLAIRFFSWEPRK